MKTLVIISSKSPNPYLLEAVQSLHDIQFKGIASTEYKIVVVDSCSDNLSEYVKLKQLFPDVDIMLTNNKNYEYGAFKQAYNFYDDYDVYMCVQDNMVWKEAVDVSLLDDNTAYTMKVFCSKGLNLHPGRIEDTANQVLTASPFCRVYKDIIYNPFYLSNCNLYIVTKNVISSIFNTLTIPPINKHGSVAYEFILGAFFILSNIETICIRSKFDKVYQTRI